MKVAFAGTPEFAAVALRAILATGYSVPLVLTQPDRPAGRGMRMQASAVKQVAVEHGLPVDQPERLRSEEQQASLVECAPDVLVVAAYGLILPEAVLALPRHGCLNIHASLLPRWRGAAPIQRAIEAGDAQTGVTIMQMDAGLDTGAMVAKRAIPILPADTTGSLHDRLAELGGEMIVEALGRLATAPLASVPQPDDGVCYAHKISKQEAALDWHQPAEELARKVRAFNPFPAAQAVLRGESLKLWEAQAEPGEGRAGVIVGADESGIRVACGTGILRLTTLQKAGGKRLPAGDFLRGFQMEAGEQFEISG